MPWTIRDIVAFQGLSPSATDWDLRWKRKVYAELPLLAHHVVVAQDAIEFVAYDDAADWVESRLESARACSTCRLSTCICRPRKSIGRPA